jgi:hypothetical protein
VLTSDEVREILDYNPDTGEFRWRKNHRLSGRRAGSPNSWGYVHIQINGRKYKAHRLAWLITYGELPEKDIDHLNNVRTDNRICNLRAVSRSVNIQNQTRGHRDSTSKYLGVSWDKHRRKWAAIIVLNYKTYHLGKFDTEEDAYSAYLESKRRMHPGYVENNGRSVGAING